MSDGNGRPVHPPFPRIPRLYRDITITEKIDGTNGLVYVTDNGDVYAGSRNRWVYPGDDNFGFASWVAQHKSDLATLGPGNHYGEWWGVGIGRGYGLFERRFSLFRLPEHTTEPPKCCGVVPVLYEGPTNWGDMEWHICHQSSKLQHSGSIAAPGFMDPEGIVIYHKAGNTSFKFTFDGDGHKGARK